MKKWIFRIVYYAVLLLNVGNTYPYKTLVLWCFAAAIFLFYLIPCLPVFIKPLAGEFIAGQKRMALNLNLLFMPVSFTLICLSFSHSDWVLVYIGWSLVLANLVEVLLFIVIQPAALAINGTTVSFKMRNLLVQKDLQQLDGIKLDGENLVVLCFDGHDDAIPIAYSWFNRQQLLVFLQAASARSGGRVVVPAEILAKLNPAYAALPA